MRFNIKTLLAKMNFMLKTDLTIACNYIEINSVTISASRQISIPLCLFYTEPTTTTRTNHQTPATQPNRDIVPLQSRDIEQSNSETRETVYANNLGNDVINLTVIDLPPPYEDV